MPSASTLAAASVSTRSTPGGLKAQDDVKLFIFKYSDDASVYGHIYDEVLFVMDCIIARVVLGQSHDTRQILVMKALPYESHIFYCSCLR